MQKIIFVWIPCLTLLAILLVGCGGEDRKPIKNKVATKEVNESKTLANIALSEEEKKARKSEAFEKMQELGQSKRAASREQKADATTQGNSENPEGAPIQETPKQQDNKTGDEDAPSGQDPANPFDNAAANPTPVKLPKEAWPIFRGNTKSTGVANSSFPAEFEVLWKYEVPQGAFEGSATIVPHPRNPNLKVAYIGDLDGKLFAFNLDSGETLWEFSAPIGYKTAPSYKDGRLFIGDMDGYFYCVDAVTGKQIWKFETQAEINSSANFYKDLVIFGSQDAYLYALETATGKKAWELETADQVRCGITIVENKAFVAGCDGGLHAINLDTGKEESSVDIGSPTGVTPAIQGDMVFVGTEQAGFFAIDWKAGEQKWHFDAEGAPIRSSASVKDSHVVFGGQNRTVYSLDPQTGKQNWIRTLKSKIESSPLIVGERVFIGSTAGRFYELDLNNGEISWQKQLDGGLVGASPTIGFGKMVIATDRGVVYCFGKK